MSGSSNNNKNKNLKERVQGMLPWNLKPAQIPLEVDSSQNQYEMPQDPRGGTYSQNYDYEHYGRRSNQQYQQPQSGQGKNQGN